MNQKVHRGKGLCGVKSKRPKGTIRGVLDGGGGPVLLTASVGVGFRENLDDLSNSQY